MWKWSWFNIIKKGKKNGSGQMLGMRKRRGVGRRKERIRHGGR